jgi:hypothetical protein
MVSHHDSNDDVTKREGEEEEDGEIEATTRKQHVCV